MATAVAQEEADLDPPLVSGGDVEGQAGPRVEPHPGSTKIVNNGLDCWHSGPKLRKTAQHSKS